VVKRGGWLVGLAAGALVLVVLAAWYVLRSPDQTEDVATPEADATPEQVVRLYIDALNAHHCDTAEAVATAAFKSVADGWCEDIAHLRHVQVHKHVMENPKWSGFPAGGHEQVANVVVCFDVDWRLFHSDGTLDQGPNGWGHGLIRASPDQPWRILDQGCC
jgi:hypothetical protein